MKTNTFPLRWPNWLPSRTSGTLGLPVVKTSAAGGCCSRFREVRGFGEAAGLRVHRELRVRFLLEFRNVAICNHAKS